MLLKKGDRVGIVGCSNGQKEQWREKIEGLFSLLQGFGLSLKISPFLFEQTPAFSGTARERAKALMDCYADREIKAVFDISGGDLANGVLPFLDFQAIEQNPKPFYGYSDVSTVVNALYRKIGAPVYLYQIQNLMGPERGRARDWFFRSLFEGEEDLFRFEHRFLRGSGMEGVMVGGTIRCFLKLAGTPYLPDFKDRLLFLENYHGAAAELCSLLTQLFEMGVYQQVRGVLLGTFTKMEQEDARPTVEEMLLSLTKETGLPVAKTNQIGHGDDSRCLVIGARYRLTDNGIGVPEVW